MQKDRCSRCGWQNRAAAKLTECPMCGHQNIRPAGPRESSQPQHPGIKEQWTPASDSPAPGADRGRPDLTPRPVPIPEQAEAPDHEPHLTTAGQRYAVLQSSKRAYLLTQTAFTILGFGFLYFHHYRLTDVFAITGWLIFAVVILFGIRWVLDVPQDCVQLGCLWTTTAVTLTWLVVISLLDVNSVVPGPQSFTRVPPKLPIQAVTEPVPPETWFAFSVQALLAVWLIWVLALDVRSRRLLKDV